MEERHCANCGHKLEGCPKCKQHPRRKVPYAPEEHVLEQLKKPTKRGKINPMPSR